MLSSVDNFTTILQWVIIVFLIMVVIGITYIYSKGNRHVTLFAAGIAALVLLTVKCFEFLDRYLNQHFLGAFDRIGVPYVEVQPGWGLMFDAWPIWVAPAVTIVLMVVAMSYWFRTRFIRGKVVIPAVSIEPSHASNSKVFTNEHVMMQLELKRLKGQLAEANNKLSQVLIDKVTESNRNQNFHMQLNNAEKQYEQLKHKLQAEIQNLRSEIETKNHECSLLMQDIEQKDLELAQTKNILKSLVEEKGLGK